MRAKSTLALICFLLGTTAAIPQVEAATTSSRSTLKQGRVTAAIPSPQAATAVRPAPIARAGKRDEAPSRTADRTPAQVQTTPAPSAHTPPAQTPPARTPAAQARANTARGARLAAIRGPATVRTAAAPRAIESESRQAARSVGIVPVALPAISRPARASTGGTPILHVAQDFGLSCVPFARMATGMNISGNGGRWWHNAAGSYARGQQPERGSVLSFPGSGGMRSGHVAVVSRVVNSRTIQIDHANWGGPGLRRGQVLRGAVVVDVSDRNDWTAVRHQVGFDSTTFGRTYPTHGFIYNRPTSTRTMVAQLGVAEAGRFEEVAELTSPHAAQHLRLSSQAFGR